jgi:fructose-1,6-bisphosphatase/inositol monophosphatase family enzyme
LLESDQPLWVIDPIDGTKNFAAGNDGFGIMLAWVVPGRAEAAWIVLPARKQVFIAEAGSGAFLNGTRIQAPSGPLGKPARGIVMAQHMPEAVSKAVVEATRGRFWPVRPAGCAAVEYTDIIQGRNEFVIYYRLLPWDHAAPALLLTEAGGCVTHVDGSPYSVRAKNQLTVVARSDAVADQVRAWLA